jgi:glycosyltransferase involved in cell wall biosynthesis
MSRNVKNVVLDARMTDFHFPGISRYAVNLAYMLPTMIGDRMRLIILSSPAAPLYENRVSTNDTRAVLLLTPVPVFSIRQQWVIPRILHDQNAFLYHCPYYVIPFFPRVPTIITIHDTIPLMYPKHSSIKARLFFRLAVRLAIRAAAHIITVSETTRSDLMRMFNVSPEHVTSIPLAADPGFRRQSDEIVDSLCSRLNLRKPYILYLGTNRPHKNLPYLLKAWQRIDSGPFILVIAGRWDNRFPQPLAYVRENRMQEDVRCIGAVDDTDLPALYSGASGFVFPSLYEGFGLPVLEAMTCGTPVVCSDTPGLRELTRDAAITFNPNRVDSIASSLLQLLSNPLLRSDLSKRGLQRAGWFSWERTARETLTIYLTVLNRYGEL